VNDVSAVSKLVLGLFVFALGAGCIGTLGDLVFSAKGNAAYTIRHQGISYGKWNRQLLRNTQERKPIEKTVPDATPNNK
jgi:hypothetical protein